MSEQTSSPPEITIRTGQPGDWADVAPIAASTWEGHDYLSEKLWQEWVSDSEGNVAVAEADGHLAGFCKVSRFGAAEWWLEGLRVASEYQGRGIARALSEYLIAWFRQNGAGLLRLSIYSGNAASKRIAESLGFRLTVSYGMMKADPVPEDYTGFKVLQPQNAAMAIRFVRSSPLYRVNHFVERYWKLYYLTDERLTAYLADNSIQVLGWRQFGQLHGIAIIFTSPPEYLHMEPEDWGLYVGYLAAPDDTTLTSMLLALRGLAARRGFDKLLWKMPTGLGLSNAAASAGLIFAWEPDDRLELYELPIRL